MLIPTVDETVRCIRESLAEVIAPTLATQGLRSAMASAVNLLHYVERRIEDEGQMLFDEAKYLQALFAEFLVFADAHPAAANLARDVRQTLGTKRDPSVYPSLKLLAQEIGQMRRHVCDALLLVQQTAGSDADQLRESLHRYASWQIMQEEKIFAAAFRGHGPRR